MTYTDQLHQTIAGIQNGTLSQTLLVSGPYGSGQRSFVSEVVNTAIPQGFDSPDVYTVSLPQDKHSIPLAEVHKARDFLSRSPLVGRVKICIFFDADFLAVEGQNAVLKSIEEPHKSSYIFFVSDYKRLLTTIVSRCQQIEIRPGKIQDISLGYRDIDSHRVSKNVIQYLDILNSPLYQRSSYLIDVLESSSKAELAFLLWIWETVHMMSLLAQTNRERYTEYVRVFSQEIQTSLDQVSPDLTALARLTDMKTSLLFSTRRRQVALENFLFTLG